MTITAHDIVTATTCPTFIEALYQFLRPVEADAQFVYSDTKGIPTLGIGYALIEKNKSGTWELRKNYQTDLANSGKNLTSTQLADMDAKLTQAMNFLNGDMCVANPFYPYYPVSQRQNVLGWTIDSTQSRALFDNAVSEYESRVKNWLGSANVAVYNSLQDSRELVALVSLAYNGIINE